MLYFHYHIICKFERLPTFKLAELRASSNIIQCTKVQAGDK